MIVIDEIWLEINSSSKVDVNHYNDDSVNQVIEAQINVQEDGGSHDNGQGGCVINI